MADQYERLVVEASEHVGRITLNNPPLNVIDHRVCDELRAAIVDLERRHEILAIVIQGSERAFSAGVDIASHDPHAFEPLLRKFHKVIRAVATCCKLTIASVRRHCLGGGAELALVCDLMYASEDAVFGFPEIKLASFPPVAAVILETVVGQKRAAELLLTARSITAKEALEMGMVNAIAADPDSLVQETLSRVQQLSPTALTIAKRALCQWDTKCFEKGLLRTEEIYLDDLMRTEDAKEGIRAYVEKRRPVWKGR